MRPCGARSIRKSPLFSADERAEDMASQSTPASFWEAASKRLPLSHDTHAPLQLPTVKKGWAWPFCRSITPGSESLGPFVFERRQDRWRLLCAAHYRAESRRLCQPWPASAQRADYSQAGRLNSKNEKRTKLRPLYSSIDIQNHRAMVVDRLDAQECRNRVSACRSKVSSRREVAYSTINGSGRAI